MGTLALVFGLRCAILKSCITRSGRFPYGGRVRCKRQEFHPAFFVSYSLSSILYLSINDHRNKHKNTPPVAISSGQFRFCEWVTKPQQIYRPPNEIPNAFMMIPTYIRGDASRAASSSDVTGSQRYEYRSAPCVTFLAYFYLRSFVLALFRS